MTSSRRFAMLRVRALFERRLCPAILLLCLSAAVLAAQNQSRLAADTSAKVDEIAGKVLATTGVPSASVAVVTDGAVVYAQAYGDARLDPKTAAAPTMRYSIGSISKQFTAAAILLLQEQGKLSLNDRGSKWLPELPRANEISIRQLLSMTSGYQDYWPQDYVMPMMVKPATTQQILNGWAKILLDFDPGKKWQYSNTNYVIAGMIVEKASGKSLYEFVQERILTPLKMTSATNTDVKQLPPPHPVGYFRNALGPLRLSPKEGAGERQPGGGLGSG